MNKIGILTHHSVYNFGANLQALSTQECLRKQGYDAYIINWIPQDLHIRYLKTTPSLQCQEHEKFFNDYYHLTEVCNTSKEVASLLDKEKFDAIIIGSDAVTRHFSFTYRYSPCRKGFRKNYLNSTDIYPNPYWGEFYKYIKRKIPMAMMSVSSQGTYWKNIKGFEKNSICKTLKKFSYISVRDSFTQEAFCYFTNNNLIPCITPDPVFSFNQNVELTVEDNIETEPYVVFSFKKQTLPPKEWLIKLKNIFNKNGYKIKSLPFPQEECEFDVDEKIQLPLSPLEWYKIIKNSKAYIGNNMHPVVVALHNKVPVFSFDYYAVRKNRFSIPEVSMSKIFDLLNNTELRDNYFNIQFGYDSIPDPEFVFKKTMNIDKSVLTNFAEKMKSEYDIMIKNMLSSLEK